MQRKRNGLKCPHCLVVFHDAWTEWSHLQQGRQSSIYPDCKWTFQAKSTLCPACGQLIFRVDRSARNSEGVLSVLESITAYPKGTSRPVPPEVEGKFESDFREACLVIGDSEKASAALSRRCLQNLLREKAETKAKDLAPQIQEVLDSGELPSHLGDAIDGVRGIGNFATHPIKSTNTGEVLEVELGEAEWLLDTLEALFDFYFVQPAKLEKKRDALNKKLKEAGKPPLKGSPSR